MYSESICVLFYKEFFNLVLIEIFKFDPTLINSNVLIKYMIVK